MRLRSRLPLVFLASWLVGAPVPVRADAAAASETASDPSLDAWLAGDGASGDWFGWRSRLSDRGFAPYAVWTGDVLRNFHGGLNTRTDWVGLLEFGTDVDFEAALGWGGAGIHVGALWIYDDGDLSADSVGNFDDVSNIAGKDAVRMYQLYVRQRLRDGAIDLKAGQLALDSDFMISDNASLFLNASLGAMPVESANTPAPIYPLAAPGGFGRWTPREDIDLLLGVYNGDAGEESSDNHGFDYHFGSSEGVMVIAELQIDTAVFRHDARWKLGGFYNSGDFTDFASGGTVSDNYALYVIVDQVLVGSGDDNLLAAFFRAGWSPQEDRNEVEWYLDGGFTARGFRQDDRFGLAVAHSRFGGDFVSAQAAAGTQVVDDETIVELTYDARLTPWLSLQPDVQFVIDPQDAKASDAFVGGFRGVVTF